MPGVAAEMRTVRSSASTPSLRSRGSDMTMGRDAPGGNVRVVVRVRAFLPRGTIGVRIIQGRTKNPFRNRKRGRMSD